MSAAAGIVIVGAGHGGVQAAASLREEGYAGPITLVSDDPNAPYQRPPLSKAFIKGEATAESLILRGPAYYPEKQIDLRLGESVAAIDRAGRIARLASGEALAYEHLILATGALARPATFAGAELDGVLALRDINDAAQLKARLENAKHVVVIGAGFIGLEFAATAAAKGAEVQVVEIAPRVMGRAVSQTISDFYADAHRGFGVNLHLGAGVGSIEGANGRVKAVHLSDGRRLPADLVLVGIGILANEQLASAAGLVVDNGVVVDEALTTSDPHISAIGDCCAHPNAYAGRVFRLESVQNATDQARVVARKIVGKEARYDALPWFWSDQGDLKLQIAGLNMGCDTFVTRGDPASRSFSVFGFSGGRLRVVESVNRAADHMIARRLIAAGASLSPQEAADPAFDLKARAMPAKSA
ncbi:MAG: FAD-dependent oxidoreductase [Methylobacteriaceae bacterium]|nr:FAD-dependent oxidoreductase [Methylobacteriaceae bacterium]